jgi:hypothetical protein
VADHCPLTKHDISKGSRTIQIAEDFYVTLSKRRLAEKLIDRWTKTPSPIELWVCWALSI